jgi:ABC-type spermidine/putrescine transport system permease subunit I
MASRTTSHTGQAETAEPTLRQRIRRSEWLGPVVNLLPSVLWLLVFFLVPLAVMFYYSFGETGSFGRVLVGIEYLGLQQYVQFFVPEESALAAIWYTVAWILEGLIPLDIQLAATDPTPYVQLTIKSIGYGVVATLVSLLVGYPAAYYIGRIAPEEYRELLLVLVILPFWASFLVRIYAIQLLLSRGSFLMEGLSLLPFVEPGLRLMNTQFAVMVGLVYIWIPFMILPVYTSIEEIDFTLQEAAMDLGADRASAFRRVIFPLSMPGVVAGSILVFIPSAGSYVIPELLGGPDSQMIGNFIANQFGSAMNWPLGAAGSFILMAVMLGAIGIYMKFGGSGDLA